MPSRPVGPPSPGPRSRRDVLLAVVVASFSALLLAVLALLLLLFCLYRSLRRARARDPTLPLDAPFASSLRRFSFRDLRSATSSFDPSRSLGRGASAVVFRGILPDGKSVAVKRLDHPSSSSPSSSPPQTSSDREFHNELHVLAALPPSPFVVSLLGYCLDSPRRRLLVYEYMPNGSLQDALFSSSDHHLVLSWDRRFGIVLDIAQALAFLHLECDSPVIHGDIKPSNILLTADFRAKISDFGLSRIKTEADLAAGPGAELFSQELFSGSPHVDFSLALRASSSNSCRNLSPMQLLTNNPNTSTSPKGKEAAAASDELCSIDHSKELGGNSPLDDGKAEANGPWGRDWWWKQDGSGELSSKDYVREWIGSQICPSSNPDWDDARKNSPEDCFDSRNSSQVERMDGGDDALFRESGLDASVGKPEKRQKKAIDGRDKKNRKMREWWKEEYFAEISSKGHSKGGLKWFRSISSHGEVIGGSNASNDLGRRGRESNLDISFRRGWKKKRSRSVGSEMFSGDLFSRELSSTASMRGTVCYVAPEYGGGCGGHLMEKADVYSFGVLILVIVSGRRPLHVLSSPMELEKANLISWCRQLAQTGNILDLVDDKLKDSYNKEQASLCVNLALLCLQRMPELRPDGGDIVKILKGEMELPLLPFECSPSPPAKPFSRSRRKTAPDAE